MLNEKILVINPGSTSTKIAVYQAEEQQWTESISHSLEDLKAYATIYDQLEMRKDIADFKGLESEIAGDPDVLVAPNIHAGIIMGKMYAISCGGKMAGFIVGAKCPIVMVSRGSSSEEKYLSIVVSAAAVK